MCPTNTVTPSVRNVLNFINHKNELISCCDFQSAVVFPKKIATEQQSLMLVKRLLAVAVSSITYLRGIFPESAYGTRYMDGEGLLP